MCRCNKCSSEIPQEAQFCPHCGAKLASAEDILVREECGRLKNKIFINFFAFCNYFAFCAYPLVNKASKLGTIEAAAPLLKKARRRLIAGLVVSCVINAFLILGIVVFVSKFINNMQRALIP